jgi:hypothetical protein
MSERLSKQPTCQVVYRSWAIKIENTDRLQLTGRNLGHVFNSRRGSMCAMRLCCCEGKRPNLKLNTRPELLLGSLPLALALT